jgi:hypothetical protein
MEMLKNFKAVESLAINGPVDPGYLPSNFLGLMKADVAIPQIIGQRQ